MTTQSQLLTGGSTGDGHFYEAGTSFVGMKFNSVNALGVGETLSQLKCSVKAFGSPTGDVTAKLYNSGGSVKETSSNTKLAQSISTDDYEWLTFDFTNTIEIANGDILAVHYSSGDGSNWLNAQWHGADVYDSTDTIFASEQTEKSDGDFTFYFTYGSAPPSSGGTRLPPPPLIARF